MALMAFNGVRTLDASCDERHLPAITMLLFLLHTSGPGFSGIPYRLLKRISGPEVKEEKEEREPLQRMCSL